LRRLSVDYLAKKLDLQKKFNFVLLPLVILPPYIYFISRGNFLVDDWGQLSNGNSFVSQISDWESLWAYRPISWIALPLAVNVLRDNFILLTIFHLALYSFSVFQIISWRILNLDVIQRRFLAILLFSPFFASTFILSPINQLSASLSLSIFALGLLFEKRSQSIRGRNFIVYFCFLLSLLSYEISAPLIFTHYMFTVLPKPRKLATIFSLPAVLILLVFWQKIIAVYIFNSDFSRLETLNPIPLISFVFTYLFSIPLALASGFISQPIYVLAIFVLFMYFLGWNLVATREVEHKPKDITILLLGFLSSGFLFLLSGRYSLIEGYQNRGLTSSWILFSVILVRSLSHRKKWLSCLIILIIAVNYVLFLGKIEDSVLASDARRTVLAEIRAQEDLISSGTTTLILDVPCLLPEAKVRTEVFCTAWDARGALAREGLKFENVFVTNDALSLDLLALKSNTLAQVIFFKGDFQVDRVSPLTPDLRRELILQSERRAKASNAKIEACKFKISQLFKLRKSGSIDEYLQCAKHPLS